MKQNQFSRRTNEIAREKLSWILLFEISDPDLQLVTVTSCEVSVDKSFMRAYVAVSLIATRRSLQLSSVQRVGFARFWVMR